jgi:hypothetical protein
MEYQIKKGKHKSKCFPSLTFKSKVSGLICFKGDFSYTLAPDKQSDTNKLFGLSDGLHHHINSIRLGWRWRNDLNCIEIMVIKYQNRKRTIEHLTYAYEDIYYNFNINIYKGFYEVEFNGIKKSFIRDTNYNFVRYKLFPYFGGSTTAPKNFKIEIND